MTFNITEHIEFDQKGRAQCPVCLTDGKTSKNLSVIPNTDGAYKCHRGCSSDDIRNMIGQPKSENSGDRIVPTALAQPKKQPKYHSRADIDANNHRLIHESKLAKQWLSDRGFDEADLLRHHLGIVKKQVVKYEAKNILEKKLLPCITVPYKFEQGWLQKYFVAPWLTIDERLDTRMIQDYGLAARWWFTQSTESKELWICEGEWDAIALSKLPHLKFDICTSTTGAGNIPTDLSDLDQYEKIYIWYDLDHADSKGKQPGPDGAIKLRAKLGDRAKICTVPHPEDYKSGYDISDAIKDGFTLDKFIEQSKLAIPTKHEAISSKKTLRSIMTTNAELLERAKDYTDWLIEEILPIDELIMIAASPRAGKSLMAMNMAYCVASGTNFMDRPVTQGSVFYVHCEDSETKIKMRQISQGWDAQLPVYWFEKFKLSQLGEMIELAKEMQPRLIILDTLSRIRDDNSTESSAEMGRILEPLQEFAREHNSCVLLVHHTGKIKIDNADTLDVFETIRGSSAIRATCRGTIVIAASESGYRMCIENGYIKQDLKVSLNLSDLTWKLLGKWLTQIDGSQADQVLQILAKTEQATLEQLHDQTLINKGSLYKVLSRLTQEGKISKTGSRKAVLYSRLLAKLPKNISDISDMSDNLSDLEINAQQTIEVMSDKKDISFLSDNTQVQKYADVTTDDVHNLSDCLTSASSQLVVTFLESDNISDKPKSVRNKALKVGDRVRIKSPHFLAGKQGVIDALIPVHGGADLAVIGYEARLSNSDFAVEPHISLKSLELIS